MRSRSCPMSQTKEIILLQQDRIMITIYSKDCNIFSQDFYNQVINDLPLHTIQCTCGKSGCLIRYGHYSRNIKFLSNLLCLIIQRLWCKECHKTHALIPSLLVPYSQVTLQDQQEIIACMEQGKPVIHILHRNYLVDECNVKYIIRQYRRHWKQRLKSIGKSLSDSLTIPCLSFYSRQFMQIRRTPNILFGPPT